MRIVRVSKGKVKRTIPRQFISVAIDASQIIGGYWWEGATETQKGLGAQRVDPIDLSDPTLTKNASHLKARYLRIGGTEADKLLYDMKKKKKKLPQGYDYILTRKRWKEILRFTSGIQSKLMVTLNAGAGPRKRKKWKKKNSRQLIQYTRDMTNEVDLWELGNEVNAFLFFYGPRGYISPGQYGRDITKLTKTLRKKGPGRSAGPAIAVWPLLGEVIPFLKPFLNKGKTKVDVLTWHYYPQQSFRSPVAVRRARSRTLLKPAPLNEFRRHARRMVRLRDLYTPDSEIWLGETGHAQCGGQPGMSDTFLSGFWWLDQLGSAALYGQDQVVRQTLVGGDYGLLDYRDFFPRPDYWTTLLWQNLMGEQVYSLQRKGSQKLRLYLHSGKERGSYVLCFINLDLKKGILLQWDESLPPGRSLYILQGRHIMDHQITLGGITLKLDPKGNLPPLKGTPMNSQRQQEIPPGSYGFITLKQEK